MHELGIVSGILDVACKTAREAGASRVVSVTVRIGDMCETVPEVGKNLLAQQISRL